jgi:hypothetical protein
MSLIFLINPISGMGAKANVFALDRSGLYTDMGISDPASWKEKEPGRIREGLIPRQLSRPSDFLSFRVVSLPSGRV